MKAYCLILLPLVFHSSENSASESSELSGADIEEVVITERRPGPPLWQVHNGENKLWVLAVVTPMPKTFQWDESSVEYIISDSQEYFPVPDKSLRIGLINPIRAVGLVRKFGKIKKNPDGKTLGDILPADTYDKFRKTTSNYGLNQKKLEKLSPFFAALKLYDEAKKNNGLIQEQRISRAVKKIAKRNKVKISPVKISEKADTKQLIADLENMPQSVHLSCMEETLDILGEHISYLTQRSQLWANGDPDALVRESLPRAGNVCVKRLMENKQIKRIEQESRELWLESVEIALGNNRSSFAVLKLSDVIEPDGLLAALESRGYKIIGPLRQ